MQGLCRPHPGICLTQLEGKVTGCFIRRERRPTYSRMAAELGVRWSEGPDSEQGARVSSERLFLFPREGVMSPTEVCRGCGGEGPGLMSGKRYQLLVACWGGGERWTASGSQDNTGETDALGTARAL